MFDINLSRTDITIMIAYLAVIVSWGLLNAKRQSAEDYFLGGRGAPWPIIGLSMFAMMVSSSALVGWAGDGYATGVSVFNYGLWAAILPIVFIVVFFLPFYLRNRIYTLPEFLGGRFDDRSRIYLSFLTVIGYTFADLAVTLYAGALVLRMVLPQFEITTLVWVLAVLAASYTLIGGLSSVMRVEMVQAIVLMGGSTILTVTAFMQAGGWSAVMEASPPGHLSLIRPVNDPSVPWPTLFISLPLLGFYFWGLSQTMVQRTLSAKSEMDGRYGILFAGVLNFVTFFVMVLPGIAGRVLYPDLERGDQIYPRLLFDMLPAGLLGLVLIGFISAMTSTVTSILNSAQTLVAMDLITKLRPGITSRQQVTAGSIAGIVIITISALWAPYIEGVGSIVKYFQQLMSYICPPVVAVFLCGILWPRATASGAFAGLLSGFAMGLALLVGIDYTPLAGWNFLYVAPVIFVVSLAVVVAVSLCTAPPSESAVKRFVWRPSFYREETAELAAVPWFKNYRVLSVLLLAAALIFIIVWR